MELKIKISINQKSSNHLKVSLLYYNHSKGEVIHYINAFELKN